MKQLLYILLIGLFSQAVSAQVEDRSILLLENEENTPFDSGNTAKPAYPRSLLYAPLKHPLNPKLYLSSSDYVIWAATHQVGLQHLDIGSEYPFISKYQVAATDFTGALIEMAVYGIFYGIEQRGLRPHKDAVLFKSD